MPTGRFDALQEEDESSDDDEPDITQTSHPGNNDEAVVVPSYEDLSVTRADEETVLAAVYGDDFSREDGVWGVARLNVHCRPPDVDQVGCELT
jgi:hypothetical protein